MQLDRESQISRHPKMIAISLQSCRAVLDFCWLTVGSPQYLLGRIYPGQPESPEDHTFKQALSDIKTEPSRDTVHEKLKHLVEADGAGSWPPRAVHGNAWPEALQPYHHIYLEVIPFLATEDIALDDKLNINRVTAFRERIRGALHDRIHLPAVVNILSPHQPDNREVLSAECFNGFYACISNLRHAFRWGVIPVVKVAQEEKVIGFPPELEEPWTLLRQRYGVTSPGGNVMANYFCNFDEAGRVVYEINSAMPDMIRQAEYNFAHMFLEIEELGLPIYNLLVASISHYNSNNKPACLSALREITLLLPGPLEIFYKTLTDRHISPKVWMRYVQGFAGWGAGEIIDGEYIEYDGLSGSHAPFFRIMDAFLNIPGYFSEENSRRYVPRRQRELCEVIRENGFRQRATFDGEGEIAAEMEVMVQQLKKFRAAHRARIHKYLSPPAPERLIMTAGKSVIESEQIPEIEAAIQHLDGILAKRIKETV
ncbi:hypothetical protein BJY04DRAFT_188244 [Aspergillus karnatakaensis]|uniref:uncharacterized protein n=1 Tax=Aspergillus karnatakaensis TaxID=1810916 RepID=UPI003CCDBC57